LPIDWPLIAPQVRRALMAGEGSYNERDVLMACLSGHWQLWRFGEQGGETEAICITETVQFPRQRKLVVRYAAGSERHFTEWLDLVEQYARDQGCQVIEAYSRRGWIKKLPDWHCRHVVMVKELKDGG